MTGVLEFVVIIFVVYWFLGSRAFAMVDVLSNCAQAVYAKWDRNSPECSPTHSYSDPRRLSRRGKNHRKGSEGSIQKERDKEFFRSKETFWEGFPFNATRPIMGSCCKSCTPKSKLTYREAYRQLPIEKRLELIEKHEKSADTGEQEEELPENIIKEPVTTRSMRNIFRTETEKDKSFMIRTFCHLTHNYRLKKYDYPEVADSVLTDTRLIEAIQTTAQTLASSVPAEEQNEEQYEEILTEQEDRARKILLDMRSTLSDFLLRVTSWILHKLLPRFLTSVCLHPSQLEMLKQAAGTKLPLIFVPLHRSHLDYILITFVLLNIDVRSPLVAAGNNLKIPVFGWLLRGLGAFFIKRRIDPAAGRKDILYRAVLHTYMMQCLEAGHNIEFYIEGGRTRTGKPCMPKGGLLSVIIDAYMAGKVEDALLVPVSVNYDKLVDGNFIRELLGQPKEMETFSSAMSAIWTTLNSNYGSMRIDFNQPFSLRELVKSFQSMNKLKRQSSSDLASNESTPTKNGYTREKVFRSVPSTTSLYGTDVVDEDHRVLVDNIARHLIYDCAKACAVMSTNILAFLLLNKYREGVKMKELVESFDKLRDLLVTENKDLGFSGSSFDVINNAVELLGPNLVERQTVVKESGFSYDIISPVTILPNVIELSYYSNSLLPHFMIEAVIALSISLTTKTYRSYGDKVGKITGETVVHHALEICNILQFEFIFTKPCQTLEVVVNKMFERFHLTELILLEKAGKWTKFVHHYDSEDEDVFAQYDQTSGRTFCINGRKEESDKLEFLSVLLRPLMDVYIVTAMCLPLLLNKEMPENDYVREVLTEIQAQVESGVCLYGESSSVEPIRNACKLLKKWGVLNVSAKDSARFVSLTAEYNTPNMITKVQRRFLRYKYQTEAYA